jgi:DASS family divalent anion:Na+ symporter
MFKRFFTTDTRENLGWSLSLIIPFLTWLVLKDVKLNWASIHFIVVFSCALMLWMFRLVPEYTPAMFLIIAIVLLGLAPTNILLSGFASDSFFLALSVFGLGALIVKSNLFERLALLLLKYLPPGAFFLQAMLFFIGMLLTPIMTAQSARVSLIAPLLDDIQKSANLKANSILMNSLACCAFHGTILLSVIFLTGKSSNFVLFGMLSKTMQWQYNWLNWLIAASVPGLLLVALFFILLRFQFKAEDYFEWDKKKLSIALSELGPINSHEWAALSATLLLILGLITSPIHKIPASWLSFIIFFVLLITGFLNKSDFRSKINWPFLFYLGAIIGIMRCINAVGLELYLTEHLAWLSHFADKHEYWFIIIIYALGSIAGLLFGTMAAPALVFSLILPIAQNAAMNTWLIAFVLLMATESWFFPYQSSYYLCFEELSEHKKNYRLKDTLSMNAYFSGFRLLVIILSLPFWQFLGVL